MKLKIISKKDAIVKMPTDYKMASSQGIFYLPSKYDLSALATADSA